MNLIKTNVLSSFLAVLGPFTNYVKVRIKIRIFKLKYKTALTPVTEFTVNTRDTNLYVAGERARATRHENKKFLLKIYFYRRSWPAGRMKKQFLFHCLVFTLQLHINRLWRPKVNLIYQNLCCLRNPLFWINEKYIGTKHSIYFIFGMQSNSNWFWKVW